MNILAVYRGWLRRSIYFAFSGTSDFNWQELNVPYPGKYFRFKYTRRIAHLTWDHWRQQNPREQLSAYWLTVLKLLPDPLRAKSQIPWKEHTRVGQKHWTGILMGTILNLGNQSQAGSLSSDIILPQAGCKPSHSGCTTNMEACYQTSSSTQMMKCIVSPSQNHDREGNLSFGVLTGRAEVEDWTD